MSKAETTILKKDFHLKVSNYKRAKDVRAQRIYGKLEPTVIDDELLTTACFAQGPTGEAGKLAEAEGIAFASVKQLSLAYNNILKIGGIEELVNITTLKLDNNIIEKIEGLDYLVNIKWLDLSFNKISKIENLENLVNLEDLSLFCNSISVIENLDQNEKLRFLSLGRNNIKNLKNILYLRQFKHLDCLTIEHNPLCDEEGYENYIFAFLGKLTYLDYKYILPQWRAKAYDKYQIAVDQMNEAQLEYEEKLVEAHKEALFLEECRKAFIDEIIGDNLFNAMFKKDKDGQTLIKLSSVAELVEQYREKCSDACKQLFLTGQEEYQKRKSEEDCLRSCIEDAKQDSKRRALESIEQYKETKKAIRKKLDDLYQDSFPEVAEALLSDLRQAIYELWNDLMGNEVSLVDQLEEIITDFGRNMSEMVSQFTESVQVCFSKVRESAGSFNERLAEMTLTYAERLAKAEQPQKTDPESSIYLDRDNLVNALNNSKEVHVAVIDKCEENVNKNLKQWLENLIEDLHQKEEYERHTNRVIEINMYIDDQRVDLETNELPLI